ncbi:periostin-related [Holotrichia oblita]|uniref:Periostin-related n=1 Tax=Holotrichia oblita TaxID=644536 RepID=A0ACB9TF88_HOLOL|nr:periostin-related [Holotrichia oblita]
MNAIIQDVYSLFQQFGEQNQRRQLSPTQQGHILSDIQQHQHRFNLQQNNLNTPTFSSQQETTQTQFNGFNLPSQLPGQQFIQQQQPFLQNQQLLTNPIVVPSQQTLLPTNQVISNSAAVPTSPTNANSNTNSPRLLQHHTQTSFTPFIQQQQIPLNNGHQHLLQVTSSPLFNLDQVKPITPEEQKQKLKELEEKQAIIEKHNQFIEKQYKKALEKAQNEHSEFLKQQQDDKKKLYQKLYKPTSQQYRYRQNRARYIYPEERDLFDLAIRKYYEEHPTTTTSTTTTTTLSPISIPDKILTESDREGRILNHNKNSEIFLSSQSNLYPTKPSATSQQLIFAPTVLPPDSEIKPISSLEDLDKLKDQYKSQEINKDDLIAQLKLAIGNVPPTLEGDKNLTSREIELPNGERVEIIRTTDPKLVPDAQRIEPGSSLDGLLQEKFHINNENIPNDSKPSGSGSLLEGLGPESIKLPNGQSIQVIKTTDPSLIPFKAAPHEDPSFDKIIRKRLKLPEGHKYEILGADQKLIKRGDSPEAIVASAPNQNDPALEQLLKTKLNLPDGDKYDIVRTTDPELLSKSSSSEEITLPNGQKVRVIKTTDPSLIPSVSPKQSDASLDELVKAKLNLPEGHKYEIIRQDSKLTPDVSAPLESPSSTVATIVKPPTAIFDELTKDVLPAGANFDILKHSGDGLEQINGLPANLPDPKKVTFVLLEEQDDGTLKVQGVKGNNDQNKEEVDVDSILKRIKEGEIKLPPASSKNTLEVDRESFVPNQIQTTSQRSLSTKEFIRAVTVTPNSQPTRDIANTNKLQQHTQSTTPVNTYFGQKRSTTTSSTFKSPHSSTANYTPVPHKPSNTSPDLIKEASTISQTSQNSIFNHYDVASTISSRATTPKYSSSTFTIYKSESLNNYSLDASDDFDLDLSGVLKRNGLFAMAKYLRQSGLDTILNETGPYTLFVPNDKAFRTLLVQLGGPDKAEEKFRDNPRLLSGLLLHHVIPGAFKITSLQDEMTGVSLAGTQLRVNQYNMHDAEWNDIKVRKYK